MNAVFVTGATGVVGSAVVDQLLRRGERVIAGVHTAAGAGRLPGGAEAREFEFGAAGPVLEASLAGANRLFLLRPPAVADVRTRLFGVVDAARAAGIGQIVFLSLQGVQANRGTPHHAVERYLRESHAPFTFLRPNFFMQNLSTTYAGRIREHGEIAVPAGRSRTAFIDARDIGRVAATVFTEPGHLRRAYTLCGEQSLGYREVARIMTAILGRRITYTSPSEREYLAALAAHGEPEDYIRVQRMIYRIVRLNASAIPNRTVRRLTGAPATTFAEFVRDHRHAWDRAPAPGDPAG